MDIHRSLLLSLLHHDKSRSRSIGTVMACMILSHSSVKPVLDLLLSDQEQPAADEKGASDKPSKAKKQKQKGVYAPQRLLSAVCKVAPHFKVTTMPHHM